jgi:hypothetical protein
LVTGETELEVIYSDVASRTAINRERRSRLMHHQRRDGGRLTARALCLSPT